MRNTNSELNSLKNHFKSLTMKKLIKTTLILMTLLYLCGVILLMRGNLYRNCVIDNYSDEQCDSCSFKATPYLLLNEDYTLTFHLKYHPY